MKERPIIFDAESVQAILDGRKTQTRRVIKPQPWKDGGYKHSPGIDKAYYYSPTGMWRFTPTDVNKADSSPHCMMELRCPYGISGDGLWVKEVCRYWFPTTDDGQPVDGSWHVRYRADGHERICQNTTWDEGDQYITPHDVGLDVEPNKWRSPIFMYRWASRIDLTVTGMRAERLQDISAVDAMWEGIAKAHNPINRMTIEALGNASSTGLACIEDFAVRWDSLNAKRGYPWANNDWVWVPDFERLEL